MAVFNLLWLKKLTPDMKRFIQLLLTFDFQGKKCDMSQGCLPDFNGTWLKTYGFLDRDDIENPNTTPDGLLNAIQAYRTKGIKACEKEGFVVDPVKDVCVPAPPPPAPGALALPVTPGKGHVASPVIQDPALGPPAGGRKRRTYRVRSQKRRRTKKFRTI
jgi:hypothetical protein